jgi:hypothetical protein
MAFLNRSALPRSLVAVTGRQYATISHGLTIAIRREDPSRIWERRCPLTPDAVHELVHKEKVNVLIQNCERRVFPADEFVKVGRARLVELFATRAHPIAFSDRPGPKFAITLRLRISFLVSRRYRCQNS